MKRLISWFAMGVTVSISLSNGSLQAQFKHRHVKTTKLKSYTGETTTATFYSRRS